MKKLAVIIPCFNEQESIAQTINDIFAALAEWQDRLEIQIIAVDDHSDDATFSTIAGLARPEINCLRLSRRSGSHVAIRAGMQMVTADAYVVLAADGQDNPQALPSMLERWEDGADIVWALRRNGKQYHPLHVRIPSAIFRRIIKTMQARTSSRIDFDRADFFLIDQKVAQAVNSCAEQNTSLFGLLIWMGFVQDYVEYDRQPRRGGQSSWSFSQRIKLAKDWMLTFSEVPLQIIFWIGVVLSLGGGSLLIALFFYAILAAAPTGWFWLLAVALLLFGAQFFIASLLGSYVKRSLEENRKRPLFMIEDIFGSIFRHNNHSEIQ